MSILTPFRKKPSDSNARIIKQTLAEFHIKARVVEIQAGSQYVRYSVRLSVRSTQQVLQLEANLALNLEASSIRITSSDTDATLVYIELPKGATEWLSLNNHLARSEATNPLECIVGQDIEGSLVTINLKETPNLLVAGHTGSGKSNLLNALLYQLLRHNPPEDLGLILIDPKQVEFAPYEGLRHLLRPIIIDHNEWNKALTWLEQEAGRRTSNTAQSHARIIIVIDEFSDLMMTNGSEVERIITDIASRSQDLGIHFFIATSRPGTDVYTDTIRNAFMSRIGLAPASEKDSFTILGEQGAEKLLGRGDGLFKENSGSAPIRLQVPRVEDSEVARLVTEMRGNHEHLS